MSAREMGELPTRDAGTRPAHAPHEIVHGLDDGSVVRHDSIVTAHFGSPM